MSKDVDLTVEVLKQIYAEAKKTNAQIVQTNARIDQTNVRLDQLREDTNSQITQLRNELSSRIVESEIRTATAISELAGTVREMTTVLRGSHDLRPRVEKCEADIAKLKKTLKSA